MSNNIAVGIDLGTSNTVIAVVEGNKATVIPDASGRRVHPSIVSFRPNGSVLVGPQAKARRVIDGANTIFSVKRMLGRRFASAEVQEMVQRVPYAIVEGENEQPVVQARSYSQTVSEISALVLRYAKALVETHVRTAVQNAVITVPANFDDAQREATRLAGRIAGFNVLRILNEPTAAALAYGYGRGMTNRVAIYDFGGGTFDVTLLQLDDQVYEVLSTAGDTFLGGDDIDEAIVNTMVEQFLGETRIDLRYHAGAMERLRAVAEQIKCRLSEQTEAVAQVQEIAYGDAGQPLDLNISVSRQQLNQIAGSLVQRSLQICEEAMRLADLTATQIDDIVLVGGTTRATVVREAVREYFGLSPRTDIDPDEVVAVGAAIQAVTLSRGSASVGSAAAGTSSVLLDVTPRALGIGVVGGFAETIIKRNAQIPLEQTRSFSTGKDDQQVVRIPICQGESNIFEDNQLLGELVLEGIRPAPRGQVRIDVTFEIDTNGILQVQARDSSTQQTQHAEVRLLGTMSEEQVEQSAEKHDQLAMADQDT
jgi:molecular chaperone DnaK